MLKTLIRLHKMAPGTLSLQNILQHHWKSTSIQQSNHGVSSILHHSGRTHSGVLSRVLLANLLNLVSIHFIPLSPVIYASPLGMSCVIKLMLSVDLNELTPSPRCWHTAWGQNWLPSGYTCSIGSFSFVAWLHLKLHFQSFKQAGEAAYKRTGSWPQILIVILPSGPDARIQVRYIADIELGVRVQCVVGIWFWLYCY